VHICSSTGSSNSSGSSSSTGSSSMDGYVWYMRKHHVVCISVYLLHNPKRNNLFTETRDDSSAN
jgi:hypothetical protein